MTLESYFLSIIIIHKYTYYMDVLGFLLDSVTGVSFFSDIFRHPSKNISNVRPLQMYGCLCIVNGDNACISVKCTQLFKEKSVQGNEEETFSTGWSLHFIDFLSYPTPH